MEQEDMSQYIREVAMDQAKTLESWIVLCLDHLGISWDNAVLCYEMKFNEGGWYSRYWIEPKVREE